MKMRITAQVEYDICRLLHHENGQVLVVSIVREATSPSMFIIRDFVANFMFSLVGEGGTVNVPGIKIFRVEEIS